MTRLALARSRLACAALVLATGLWVPDGNAQEPADGSEGPPAGGSPTAAPGRGTPRSTPGQDGQPAQLERVEVTGGRDSEARRASTAARIVIGREEIERFGDSSIVETLRRLPGITTGGRPGRGGEPRMRGMGAGYTQILINGERMPPGFSLDSLPPDQVERIEIMRAPTAEHGARAVAGTINIVLREALQQRLNDLRATLASERGRLQPQMSWTRNDALGELGAYNFTLSATRTDRLDDIDNRSLADDLATGAPVLDQHETGLGHDRRDNVHLHSRVQWRVGPATSLVLMPFLVASRSSGEATRDLTQTIGATPPPYAHADSSSEARFSLLRVNAQGQQRLGDDTRLELRGYVGGANWRSDSERHEFDASGAAVRRIDDATRNQDRNWSLSGKLSHKTTAEHSLVGGWEAESATRERTRMTLQNGQPLLADYGEEFSASTMRYAAYMQDEWNPSSQWSAYAGLRWERIATRSDAATVDARNQSDVWTPLLHAVWKPDEKSRDQIRASLTRSYKPPTLNDLIARPSISLRYPAPGGNIATSPDRAGNADLKPEVARGIDVAYEKYLSKGGVLSANLFYRNIANLIRTVTAEEAVSWATVPRWVARPQNVGGAVTQGIELEAKFRLDEFNAEAPPLSINSNLSVFRSRVEGVPGPNNRIDQQPKATANLGGEYRARTVPVRLGASINWTPAYTIQRTDTQSSYTSAKIVADAFVLWLISAETQLRFSASNFAPRDYTTSNTILADGQRQTSVNAGATQVNYAVRLELKL